MHHKLGATTCLRDAKTLIYAMSLLLLSTPNISFWETWLWMLLLTNITALFMDQLFSRPSMPLCIEMPRQCLKPLFQRCHTDIDIAFRVTRSADISPRNATHFGYFPVNLQKFWAIFFQIAEVWTILLSKLWFGQFLELFGYFWGHYLVALAMSVHCPTGLRFL